MLQDGIIGEVNRTDTSKTYYLVRNDITHIVYGPGDFFKRHSDYLSVTSNIVEECVRLPGCACSPPVTRHARRALACNGKQLTLLGSVSAQVHAYHLRHAARHRAAEWGADIDSHLA